MEKTEKKYALHIFEPQNTEQVWMRFSSPTPFLNINVGDLINPSIWPETGVHLLEIINMLRVINVEHIVWETEGQIRHTMLIYTEQVEESEEIRLNRGK